MPTRRSIRPTLAALVLLATLGVLAAAPAGAKRPGHTIVFNGEDNRLNAYDVDAGFKKQTVIRSAADDKRRGKDLNAQICFFPDGSRRFVAGEDTAQGGSGGHPGWGIFQLRGNRIGSFSASQLGKLQPTYQTSETPSTPIESNPENYGCGFLRDGRILTSDVGNQYPGTANNGQLIVWFPPFNTAKVRYCKVDVSLPTSGGIYVDRWDRVHVAANRPSFPDPTARPSGIYRYSDPFPTSDTPAGGCDSKDATGAPMTTKVRPEVFIPGTSLAGGVLTPSAIIRAPSGGFFVSSVFDGKIAEYTADGAFRRMVLEPGPGLPPYGTGTPYGIGIDRRGTLYYADLGVTVGPPPGPGDHNGTVRRIRFVNGVARPPEVIDRGLGFPDGIGILTL